MAPVWLGIKQADTAFIQKKEVFILIRRMPHPENKLSKKVVFTTINHATQEVRIAGTKARLFCGYIGQYCHVLIHIKFSFPLLVLTPTITLEGTLNGLLYNATQEAAVSPARWY
jgi:hypothetical protein